MVMNTNKYIEEVNRQLNDEHFYKKVNNNQHQSSQENILKCFEEIKNNNPGISKQFDLFPTNIRNPQFYILPKTHKQFDASLPQDILDGPSCLHAVPTRKIFLNTWTMF